MTRQALRKQASQGSPGKDVAKGLAQRDPPLDPVELAWHLCQFARAKWQSYMSAYRCPQAHLRDPHATFASCVRCSQPSFSLVDEIAVAPERLWYF